MSKAKDITGQKFNRLTAISFSHKNNYGTSYWLFKCDCGVEKAMGKAGVISGHAKSCGCLQKEKARAEKIEANTTHKFSKTPFYNVYCGMLARCRNKNHPAYSDYGGRGIKVLFTSFEQFRDEMYSAYLRAIEKYQGQRISINRVDNDGSYEARNCEWTTQKWQTRNIRTNRFLTFNKEKKTIAEWGEILKMQPSTIQHRLNKGWSVKRTLTETVFGGQPFTLGEETKTIPEWSKKLGIKAPTIYARLKKGWSVERALAV
ncbi:hypothetical protein LCGC14_1825160 [marine sediment metagenome]|uniref:Uncharacterized protein n=1 Tax=marine sediment metagenome TaxID=412755 RepID=A0A0F9GHQ7_9ZZZZ